MKTIEDHGIKLRNKSVGNHKTICPECSHTRRNKKEPCLSVNIEPDGGAVWMCHHCEWKGAVAGSDFKRDMPINKRKEYKRPEPPKKSDPESQPMFDWFKQRGISRETVKAFNITRTSSWFGDGEQACYAFPYYKDGELVNIKYRSKDKQFRQEGGAERTLFNIDRVKSTWDVIGKKEVIFVEGEMDVLAMYEAGFYNTVSLPDGAPKTAKFDADDFRLCRIAIGCWMQRK